MKLRKLFIANRGEIVRRIAQTAHAMGIQTATIWDSSPTPEYCCGLIDDWIRIEPFAPGIYMDAAKLIEAAKAAGCDSVHPGYGFLSEREAFAQAVVDAGMTWVGPNAKAIEAMGSKSAARKIARQENVPIIHGFSFSGICKTGAKEAAAQAATLKLPILIKPALGGGGKGMRIVPSPENLQAELEAAAKEALDLLGDDALLVEHYCQKVRHVEVQILADRHGQVFSVGDRDCSLQRRHQKVIEEAPAPGLSDKMREDLASSARRLAKAVGYDSVGTVEFLVDEADQVFYFLEMNTRLQVEHCVTEEAFGIDLVKEAIEVAQGKKLTSVPQVATRHSVQARLYAEDSENNFFPAPGPILAFLPAQLPGIRWEVGIDVMDHIYPFYDPMMAKCIATAATREAAFARLSEALRESVVVGTKNSLHFLAVLTEDRRLRERALDTGFLKRELATLQERMHKEALPFTLTQQDVAGCFSGKKSSELSVDSVFAACFAKETGPCKQITLLGQHAASSQRFRRTLCYARAIIDGHSAWLLACEDRGEVSHHICSRAVVQSFSTVQNFAAARLAETSHAIVAPVPGTVVQIRVLQDRPVDKATPLFVLESMKMQFEVASTRSGKLAKIHVQEGMLVEAGTVLATWQDE